MSRRPDFGLQESRSELIRRLLANPGGSRNHRTRKLLENARDLLSSLKNVLEFGGYKVRIAERSGTGSAYGLSSAWTEVKMAVQRGWGWFTWTDDFSVRVTREPATRTITMLVVARGFSDDLIVNPSEMDSSVALKSLHRTIRSHFRI